jgi:segregation and condensation protein B
MEVDLSSNPETHLNGVNGVAHDAPALDETLVEPAAEQVAETVADAAVTEVDGVPAIVFAPPRPDPPAVEPVADAEEGASVETADTAMLESILESLLLASGQPVPLARLVETLDGHDRKAVVSALKALTERYEREGRGLRVVHVGGGWQLRSAPEHGPWVRRLLGGRPPRLSRPMLETLAIIAYRQPCTRAEIEAIRGVDADAVVSTLLERRLIRIQGRKEAPGRPLLYGTTRDFLEVFGLPDLAALPPLADLGDGAELLASAGLGAETAPATDAPAVEAATESQPELDAAPEPEATIEAPAADEDGPET